MREVSFVVWGVAQPAGSKRAFVLPGKNGAKPRAIVTEDNVRSKPWKQEVAAAAAEAMGRAPLFDGPVGLFVSFARVRPKGHFNRNGDLNPGGRKHRYPTTKPDATKLLRGLEDALRGIAWRDDAQVVFQQVEKVWGSLACARVTIREY